MKFVFLLIFSLTLSWKANAFNQKKIVDCFFMNENKTSVQLVCNDIPNERGDNNCFELNFESDQSSANRKKVIRLETGNCQNDTFDTNLLEQFQSLQGLDISSHGVTTLPERLPNIKNLQVLIVSNNNITTIPTKLFDHAQDLSVIDFSNNKIQQIPIFDNKNLPLKEMNFSSNSISSVETFSQFKQLQSLDLSQNQIQTIEKNTFAQNEQLTELLLDHNQIKQFECANLTKLEKINMSHNQLTQINFTLVLQSAKKLTVLNVEANNLTDSSEIAEDSFKNLTSVRVSGNKILCDKVIEMCRKFNITDCHCNTIDSIEYTTETSLTQSTEPNEHRMTESTAAADTSNSTDHTLPSSSTEQTDTSEITVSSTLSTTNQTASTAITPHQNFTTSTVAPPPSNDNTLTIIIIVLAVILVGFIIFLLFKKGIISNAIERFNNRRSANANQRNEEIENAHL